MTVVAGILGGVIAAFVIAFGWVWVVNRQLTRSEREAAHLVAGQR